MDSEHDYEAIPDNYPLSVHMTAGSIAGVVEHVAMYPVDCVKTNLQMLKSRPYKSITDGMIKMATSKEGYTRLWRGMPAMIVGAGPAHAMYFASYEWNKDKLTKYFNGGKSKKNSDLANGLAGASATFFHDAVMTPAEAIKQRMQMHNSKYKSCTECIKNMYKKEGIRSFYRSFTTQYLMNAPFQMIHFVVYEKAQEKLNPARKYDPKTHMISGMLAGGVASFVTCPLDVCKTLLNTQHQDSPVRGLPNAVTAVYKVNGLKTFFRGALARVLYQSPATALSWSVYELFKRNLLNKDEE